MGIELHVANFMKEERSIFSDYMQGEQNGKILLAQVKDAICSGDKRQLEAFANILCTNPATGKIGRAIKRDYSKFMYHNIYQ